MDYASFRVKYPTGVSRTVIWTMKYHYHVLYVAHTMVSQGEVGFFMHPARNQTILYNGSGPSNSVVYDVVDFNSVTCRSTWQLIAHKFSAVFKYEQ